MAVAPTADCLIVQQRDTTILFSGRASFASGQPTLRWVTFFRIARE